MNNKISNQKTQVPQTNAMNDKDYLSTILEIQKSMVKNLSVALTEASNNELYNDYYYMFDEITNLQTQTYDLMFKKGWYCLEMAEENKINEKLNMLEQELPQLDANI